MRFQYIPYIWPLIASASVSMYLGIYTVLRRRNVKGALSFILCMLAVTVWSFANALEMAGADLATKLFWANVQYFAYDYCPVLFLTLSMEFTGNDLWVRSRKILWFAVIPTIIIILVWTDTFHGLVRYDFRLDYSGSFPVIAKEYGPVFYVHVAYAHILNFLAWSLLVIAVFFKNNIYRKQAAAVLAGISLILLSNILYVAGLSPVKRIDVTPVLFGPAGLIMALGIFRFKLLDVIPVAWATVIEIMDAGIMVLDQRNRVLDINPAFERIAGVSSSTASGKPVEEVCGNIPVLAAACADKSITHSEFSIDTEGSARVYEALISPLANERGAPIGRLAVAYDMTKRKQEQQAYLKQQWQLAVAMEKERHSRDMHDNLGQVLSFITLQAEGIKQELVNAEVGIAVDKLDKLVYAAQNANNELRKYIRNARSAETMDTDFVAALKQIVMSFERQAEAKVKLDVPAGFSGEGIDPNVRINILNIVREALNNVSKYAEADNVDISLSLKQGWLYVTVLDDGKGFDADAYQKGLNPTFGLRIMKERASEIGGQIEIKSAIGTGSRVSLCLPVKEDIEDGTESNAG